MKVKLLAKIPHMTVGKIYHVTEHEKEVFRVYNDFGYAVSISAKALEVIAESPPEFQEILDNFSGDAKGFLVPDVRVEYVEREKEKITYKDFLASMPKSSDACVTMYEDNSSTVYVYGLEFDCPTEERAEEVYAALITLFKEYV